MTETTGFLPLPTANTTEGAPRRTGVEIEFGELDEHRSADIVADVLGGEVIAEGSHGYTVKGTEIGDVQVYLDTALRKKSDTKLSELGLDLGRVLIPVEIVTEPLEEMQPLEPLIAALRKAGAKGSGDGLFYGFGIHFNPEVVALEAKHVVPVAKAYAFAEDDLRAEWPIDTSRRLLPFTDRYPSRYLDAIAGETFETLDPFMTVYLETTPSRNRGLDLLPLFRSYDEEAFLAQTKDMGSVSARPTWHFRLPDCRIDEADWSLGHEWRRWVFVERLAQYADLLARLEDEWLAYRDTTFETRADWIARLRPLLKDLCQEVLGDV